MNLSRPRVPVRRTLTGLGWKPFSLKRRTVWIAPNGNAFSFRDAAIWARILRHEVKE